MFSDHDRSACAESSALSDRTAEVPRARTASPGETSPGTRQGGKIAQRTVPYNLRPDALRVELIDLGDAFRAYQQRTEPDLVLLATLHERKARAFAQWAEVAGIPSLQHEADRAHKAAQTTREMHHNRAGTVDGDATSGNVPVVERLLTPGQALHARTVLDHVPAQAPHPEAAVHLAVLMLTLRAARNGTGNITGQDLTSWLHGEAEPVLEKLVTTGWLRLPGTITEALTSRPEDPTALTIPTLLPEQCPFTFGKNTRAKLSGWAQKVVGDRNLRKKKLGAASRLLALYTAAHTRPDGRLGHPENDGLHLGRIATFCALPGEEIAEHAELLLHAEWLAEADTADGQLRGRLAERVLPLSGLL
ncbi:hypothetical protein [Streptomyces sp. WZ-12]|uniref:hypothetical protein n=1 Tax=Streptomyces sp. WZ-12 TaxID=3030210 RepID=UPI0031590C6A